MDQQKTGALIRRLRLEKGLTQRALAEAVGVGDKAVSKWERGAGCPDVGTLGALAEALGTGVDQLLSGCLEANDTEGGNMKRIQFYVCPSCGNLMTATGAAELSCCGRRLEPLQAQPADEAHRPAVEQVEDEDYITFAHGMEKEHYIVFAALVGYDRVTVVRLYPEQGAELRIPRLRREKLYWYCSRHGLFTS